MRALLLLLGLIAVAAVAIVFLGEKGQDAGRLPLPRADGGARSEGGALGEPDAAAGRRARVAVDVMVASSFARDARGVPEVAVVAGVATDREAVVSGLGAAASGDGPVRLVARRGSSGPDGTCRVGLEVPAEWLAAREPEDLWLWGAVVQPGYQERTRIVPFPPEVRAAGDAASLRVLARRGATVGGKISFEDGTPAEGTRLRLLLDAGAGGELEAEDWTAAGPTGVFRLHADRPGSFAVHAMHPTHGSAFEDGIVVRPNEPPPVVDLVVRVSGVISGTARDPGGAPARLQRLWALPADFAGTGLHESTRLREVRGDGLIDAQRATGEDGAFRFTGLRPGEYVVRAFDGVAGEFGEVLTEASVATGTEGLELVVVRHAVFVRVLDEAGAQQAPRVLPARDPSMDGELSVYCARATPEGRLDPQRSRREVHATVSPDGAVAFHVEPGVDYVLGVLSPEHPLVEERLLLAPDVYEVEREVRLSAPSPPAVLELRILRPDGEPFAEHVTVRVRSEATGCPVQVSDEDHEGPGFTAKLPAGTWRVDVDAEPPRGHHGEHVEPTPFAPVERTVTLVAGETHAADVRLGASGRIEVWVELPPGWSPAPAGSPRENPRDPEDPDGEAFEAFRRRIGGARVELRSPAGDVVRPVFDLSYVRDLDLPAHLGAVQTSWAPPGIPVASMNPLPVGTWTAVLDAPGCVPLELAVEIRPGALARVEAALELVQPPAKR